MQGDSGKHQTSPLQQWIRDLTLPFIIKLFATPKAVSWIYSYRINWDEPVTATASAPSASASQELASRIS